MPDKMIDQLNREMANRYRNAPTQGPLWTLKHRFVDLVDQHDALVRRTEALELKNTQMAAYIRELTEVIEEMDRAAAGKLP